MAVKSPGAILRSSFRPEKVFFDQVSGVWSPAADFRIECRSPPRRNRRENGGGRFFDRIVGLRGRGRPRPLKQPPGGLSRRRCAVVARQRRPRPGGAPQPSADAQQFVVGAAQNALGAGRRAAAPPRLSPVAGNSTGAASTPSPAKHRPAPRPGAGSPAESPIERVGWSPSSARRRGRRPRRADSARNRCRPPNGAEREVRAARRRGGLSQRLMACLHACSAVTPSAAVAVTSGTSAAAAKRPAGGVRDPLAGRVPAQRLRASRPSREEANGSLSATAAARVAANGGELLSALPRPPRKPAGCARTVLPARNRPQSRSEGPAERHTTTVGRS